MFVSDTAASNSSGGGGRTARLYRRLPGSETLSSWRGGRRGRARNQQTAGWELIWHGGLYYGLAPASPHLLCWECAEVPYSRLLCTYEGKSCICNTIRIAILSNTLFSVVFWLCGNNHWHFLFITGDVTVFIIWSYKFSSQWCIHKLFELLQLFPLPYYYEVTWIINHLQSPVS